MSLVMVAAFVIAGIVVYQCTRGARSDFERALQQFTDDFHSTESAAVGKLADTAADTNGERCVRPEGKAGGHVSIDMGGVGGSTAAA